MQQTMLVQSASAVETERFGETIGGRLRGGEVIELSSDLGGGKTTLVRGLVRGAGSQDHVSSPTFTLSKVYKTPDFEIHHFDFYRLPEAGLIAHELHELLHDQKIVVLIEWSGIVRHVLPEKRLTIEIIQSDEDARELRITAHPSLLYLVEDKA